MTNLEVMKKRLINQIEHMNIEDFMKLITILEETVENRKNEIVDMNMFFPCDECRKYFGECSKNGGPEECDERFMKFAISKALQ